MDEQLREDFTQLLYIVNALIGISAELLALELPSMLKDLKMAKESLDDIAHRYGIPHREN